jgi:hypothetical protein
MVHNGENWALCPLCPKFEHNLKQSLPHNRGKEKSTNLHHRNFAQNVHATVFHFITNQQVSNSLLVTKDVGAFQK